MTRGGERVCFPAAPAAVLLAAALLAATPFLGAAASPSAGGRGETAALLPPPAAEARVLRTVRRGDTLGAIMKRLGIPGDEAHAANEALRGVFDVRRLRPGQRLTFVHRPEAGDGGGVLRSVEIEASAERSVVVARQAGGGFAARTTYNRLERRLARARATIRSSLYEAGLKARLPPRILHRLIGIYSWDVDFQREVQPGDSFDVAFERLHREDGGFAADGEIVSCALTRGGREHRLYRYEFAPGRFDYFDRRGRSARKPLMRTPIDGGRLTSGYGRRKHPVLGYTHVHRGVDFAAPRGTPVYAAGDGRIVRMGWNGAYGRYLRIRHDARYDTAYAHLHAFRRGLRPGARIAQGQVIGYVGSTGRTTGPHLHYEVLVGGRRVNPLRVKLPSGHVLRGEALAAFDDRRREIDRRIAAAPTAIEISRR